MHSAEVRPGVDPKVPAGQSVHVPEEATEYLPGTLHVYTCGSRGCGGRAAGMGSVSQECAVIQCARACVLLLGEGDMCMS